MIVQVIDGEVRKREALENAVYGTKQNKALQYPRIANPMGDRDSALRGSSNDLISRIMKLDVFATNTTSTKDSSPFKLPLVTKQRNSIDQLRTSEEPLLANQRSQSVISLNQPTLPNRAKAKNESQGRLGSVPRSRVSSLKDIKERVHSIDHATSQPSYFQLDPPLPVLPNHQSLQNENPYQL